MLWQFTKANITSKTLKHIYRKSCPCPKCMHFNSKNFCCRSYEVNSLHMYDCFLLKDRGLLMLFAFRRLFFEMRRLEGRCRNENGKANVVESLVEAVKQRSIKHIERKWKEQSVFIFSCLSIQLFIQPCFSIQSADKKSETRTSS